MPLLLITGYPASGKSTVTERIVDYFKETKGYKNSVEIISDSSNPGFFRDIYNDSHKEREHRGYLRSLVQRHLSKEKLVICDSLNYVKGYRYELFCIGKLIKTTFAVVFCDAKNENCCQFLNAQKENENERYTVEKLSDLIMRYERPETKNRWDSPLFTVTIDHRSEDQLPRNCPVPLADIYSALIEGRPLASNMSTQSAPLARTDFLQDIDRITQTIVISVMEQQQTAMPGDQLTVPGIDGDENRVNFTGIRSLPALTRLKRQFITYTKMHPIDGERRLAALFVNFLNNNR